MRPTYSGHSPKRVWTLFVTDLGRGNVLYGAYYYGATMLWKAKLLCRMTLGLWNDEVITQMDIIRRAEKLDVDLHDDDDKIER